jgi:hypothetical protein
MDMMSGGEKSSKPGFVSSIHQKHYLILLVENLWMLNHWYHVPILFCLPCYHLNWKLLVMTGKIWLPRL